MMTHTCDGRCCATPGRFNLSIRQLFDRRLGDDAVQAEQAARVLAVFRLVPEEYGMDFPQMRCLALGEGGCVLAREARPRMCTDFPYADEKPCRHCGARSDAQARGVAMTLRLPATP